MNLKGLFIVSISALAVSSFAQVTGTFSVDSSDNIGTGLSDGFVGLTHDNFTPDPSFSLSSYSFEGFCTDLEIPAYYGTNYSPDTQVTTQDFYSLNQAGMPNPQLGSEISWIANTYGFTTDSGTATAAQLAIWEIQGTSLGDIESYLGGGFTANVATQAAGYVVGAEEAYASGVRSVSPWFESPYTNGQQVTQDFVQPTATPECPPTLVVSVGLVGLFLRRKARKA